MTKIECDNGKHIEVLVMGSASNPGNIIDDIENKTEIKSCLNSHGIYTKKGSRTTRNGYFKINIDQHKYLLSIDGYYIFVVQNQNIGEIIFQKKIRAQKLENKFKFCNRIVTKHHYFGLNWTKIMLPYFMFTED